MKDKDKKNVSDAEENEKIHVSDSVFKTAREMQIRQAAEMEQKQAELQHQQKLREKRKREAYDRRIIEEKKELLRLKQGQIEESEIIPEQTAEAVKLTPWQSFRNFLYHNKWWLWIAVVLTALAAFLIYDLVSRDNPDVVLLIVSDNEAFNAHEGISDYFEEFTSDTNGNNEILASIHLIPYSDNYRKNYSNGTDTKLSVEFQSDDAVIVIAEDKLSDVLNPEDSFVDLSELYPDNEHVKGCRFYLKGTDFAQKTGIPQEAVTDDLYLAIRKPMNLLYCDEEDIQKTYDKDFSVFDGVIKDLGK